MLKGWGREKKNPLKPKEPLKTKTDPSSWCFQHRIQLSNTLSKPKCCQNRCKTVLFLKFSQTNLSEEAGQLWSKKRDECEIVGLVNFPQTSHPPQNPDSTPRDELLSTYLLFIYLFIYLVYNPCSSDCFLQKREA